MSFVVKAENGNQKECETRSEAEDIKADMEGLGMTCEIEHMESDGGEVVAQVENEKLDESGGTVETIPDAKPSLSDDPLDFVPSHFVDQIQGVTVINRKGYAVLAAQYGVSVKADPITLPSDSGFEYAEFRAVATTESGEEYSGFGSANVDRGDDRNLLAELAETRAMKRATAWATGIGMTAIEEMKGEL